MIGDRIKQYRVDHGLKQEELADMLFVTRAAVSKWENGKGIPDVDNLQRLADLLGITLDDLMGRDSQTEGSVRISKKISIKVIIWILTAALLLAGTITMVVFLCNRLKVPALSDVTSITWKEYAYLDHYDLYGHDLEEQEALLSLLCHAKHIKRVDVLNEPQTYQLCEIRIVTDSKPDMVLKIYRGTDGFYVYDRWKKKLYSCSAELITELDQTAVKQNPKHLSYFEGAGTEGTILAKDVEIPVSIKIATPEEAEELSGLGFSISKISSGNESRLIMTSSIPEPEKAEEWTPVFYISDETCSFINRTDQLNAIDIAFYIDSRDQPLGTVRIPAYELGDYPIDCLITKQDGEWTAKQHQEE